LHGAANAAKEIELPGGVEARVVEFSLSGVARRARWGGRFAEKVVIIGGVALDGGREVERGQPTQGAGFLEVRRGDAQVVVVGDRPFDEAVELRIIETFPLCGQRGFVDGSRVGGAVGEGAGHGGLGRLVIRSDGAAGENGESGERGSIRR